MATFTIDLLTGDVYLFSGNFSGSGSTPTSGSTYPQVLNYGSLPSPASSYTGDIYVVQTGSGGYVLNRKDAGLYISLGGVWRNMGDTPAYFKSDNFQIYDSVDTSKGAMFVTSGVTGGIFRKLKIQNSDGTIAYLTDLNTKVDKTVFADYTGTTAPATYLTKTAFGAFTGTTLPANYYNKTQINAYSAATLILINGKQNALIAGPGIKIAGNIISVTGFSNTTLQLLDTVGGVNVNTVTATPIVWTSQVFSGTSLSYTGGSRIYVQANGVYEISYVLNVVNDTGSAKNIGTVIRKNGNEDITPMSTSSFSQNATNDSSSNTMPQYLVSLSSGNYVQLMAFRIGTTGNALTNANTSWIKIKRIT